MNVPLLALVVLATLAAVIASQALISGAYSLTHSAIHLGFFPRVTIRHTSRQAEGQIYAPVINWILAVACVILVLVFKESSRLAAAYGIAVTGTMGITSVVYYVVARETWGWSRAKALPLLVLFLSFDLPFLASNTLKFKDGGYVPIAVGVVFLTVMLVWNVGRRHLGDVLRAKSPPLDAFLARLPEPDGAPVSGSSRTAGVIQRVPGTGIYMASNPEGVPPVIIHQTERLHVLPWHVVLLTIRFEHVPHVPEAERATVEALGQGFTRVIGRVGFMDRPEVPPLLAFASRDPAFGAELVDETYYLGRETFIASDKGKMGSWTEGLFAILSRNSTSATTYFEIPPEKVLELGSQIDL